MLLLIGNMHGVCFVRQSREEAGPRSVNARVHFLHLVAGDLDHRVVLRGQRYGFIERQLARLRVGGRRRTRSSAALPLQLAPFPYGLRSEATAPGRESRW